MLIRITIMEKIISNINFVWNNRFYC